LIVSPAWASERGEVVNATDRDRLRHEFAALALLELVHYRASIDEAVGILQTLQGLDVDQAHRTLCDGVGGPAAEAARLSMSVDRAADRSSDPDWGF
jgi:hypothetical protein